MKKTFFDVLWALCESEGLITKWKEEGFLLETDSRFAWHPKVGAILGNEEIKIVGTITVNDKQETKLNVSKKKELVDIPWLSEFSEKFSKLKIGFSGKVTDKATTLTKMNKFLEVYSYTKEEILGATDMYIESLKRSGSIQYIRNSGYFIFKVIDGVQQSDLASWCEEYRNSGNKGLYNSRTIL